MIATSKIDRRQLLLGGALLTAGAAATALRPISGNHRSAGTDLERVVPSKIGPYRFASSTGLIVPSRDEMRSGIYDQVLTRVYIADGRPPVMLLIAYGSAQDADLALHRPEACYPSAGYRLDQERELPLAGIAGASATALTAIRGGHQEQLYFWSRIGRDFPPTRLQEKWAVLRYNLRREMPDGVLVRLSIRSPDWKEATRQMIEFNSTLLSSMELEGRHLLLGPDDLP
jgi:EpsI family protein